MVKWAVANRSSWAVTNRCSKRRCNRNTSAASARSQTVVTRSADNVTPTSNAAMACPKRNCAPMVCCSTTKSASSHSHANIRSMLIARPEPKPNHQRPPKIVHINSATSNWATVPIAVNLWTAQKVVATNSIVHRDWHSTKTPTNVIIQIWCQTAMLRLSLVSPVHQKHALKVLVLPNNVSTSQTIANAISCATKVAHGCTHAVLAQLLARNSTSAKMPRMSPIVVIWPCQRSQNHLHRRKPDMTWDSVNN